MAPAAHLLGPSLSSRDAAPQAQADNVHLSAESIIGLTFGVLMALLAAFSIYQAACLATSRLLPAHTLHSQSRSPHCEQHALGDGLSSRTAQPAAQ